MNLTAQTQEKIFCYWRFVLKHIIRSFFINFKGLIMFASKFDRINKLAAKISIITDSYLLPQNKHRNRLLAISKK